MMELTKRQKRLIINAIDNHTRIIKNNIHNYNYSERELADTHDMLHEYDEILGELLKED